MFKKLFNRSREDRILNKSIPVVVGGCGKTQPKRVELREPSIKAQTRHMNMIISSVAQLLQQDTGIVERMRARIEAYDTEDPTRIEKALSGVMEDVPNFGPLASSFAKIIAELVDENETYIGDEMSFDQLSTVVQAYIALTGIKNIRRAFFSMAEMWKGNEKVISLRPSSQSPTQPETHQNGSTNIGA